MADLFQVDVLTNLANSLAPVQRMITGAAYVMGVAFLFKALYTLRVYGESRTMMSTNQSIKEPILYLMVGAVFIYLPTAFSTLMQTTFGYTSVLQFAAVSGRNDTLSFLGGNNAMGRALAMIIQVVGLIAFVRGWILLARSASQGQPPGGTGKGLMHIFGGILAINVLGTIEVINNTLYSTG
jgi:intracellular multiplication protein IcmC